MAEMVPRFTLIGFWLIVNRRALDLARGRSPIGSHVSTNTLTAAGWLRRAAGTSAVNLVLLTKVDLLAVLPDISIERIRENLSMVMPQPLMIPVSATSGLGIDEWVHWLEDLKLVSATKHRHAHAGTHAHTQDHHHHHAHSS